MLNPIFWKEVQGQKHHGRWEIAERQIPSTKMLFKTNTKGHKWEIAERQIPGIKMLFETNTKGHTRPSSRLFIIERW